MDFTRAISPVDNKIKTVKMKPLEEKMTNLKVIMNSADMWQADSVQFAMVLPEQKGFWEFGAALKDDKTTLIHN